MNNEFSNCIKVALIDDVDTISNGDIILKEGRTMDTFHSADFSIDPQTQEGKPSLLHSIVQSFHIDKVTPEQARRLSIARRVLIRFEISGRPFVLGSRLYPALAYITPGLQSDILRVSHKSPETYKL